MKVENFDFHILMFVFIKPVDTLVIKWIISEIWLHMKNTILDLMDKSAEFTSRDVNKWFIASEDTLSAIVELATWHTLMNPVRLEHFHLNSRNESQYS